MLGEPTQDREDLDEHSRSLPDLDTVKAFIIPPGCGIIIKKGTWHDFPVSCGPPLTAFIINTMEVVEALAAMPAPAPMDQGDCYKIRCSDKFGSTVLHFPDPRPLVHSLGFVKTPPAMQRLAGGVPSYGPHGYGDGLCRCEVAAEWGTAGGAHSSPSVWVVPIINVEVFVRGAGGPSIQPHLQGTPEIANAGWRDYGIRRGLERLTFLFRAHGLPATAVVSSDAVADASILSKVKLSGWEIGAHGANNSDGGLAGLDGQEEVVAIKACLKRLTAAFDSTPSTWLTPGFSVNEKTPAHLAEAGITTLLDFCDDDVPYTLHSDGGGSLLCLPYSMETNDFSLILGRHLSARDYATSLESHVLQLAAESRRDGKSTVVCLGMHTFVAGTPAVVFELDQVLKRLSASPNVRFATASQVAAAVRSTASSRVNHAELITSIVSSQSYIRTHSLQISKMALVTCSLAIGAVVAGTLRYVRR